jgi:hypothetical protein
MERVLYIIMDNKFAGFIKDKSIIENVKYTYTKLRDPILWTKSPIIRKWIYDDYAR